MISETACAKINLALHVTGQRADGYHLLDSLVVFADTGDRIRVSEAENLTLNITGPQADKLKASPGNLVLRAARAFGLHKGAAITLEKHLPIASGIGGGSADAAATLRALAALWQVPLPPTAAVLALGADVPVCLGDRPCRMQGVGNIITPLPRPLPRVWLVLANPGVAVSTPTVFRRLTQRNNPPLPPTLPALHNLPDLLTFLATTRNDLEPTATANTPEILRVKS
ncbi:4-(cytidine 5'-diphospho)-2-C-methyl-D-erythritol kinase, partial [Pseudorhodobacter sp.]|uniref:4-(cytidine 5'-diphospho)-2-C-methyl-D-erythritol kinase n=1 Tax=Pseudorhodobacter sp. TaxID=1934400 RepID=UPI0026483B5C